MNTIESETFKVTQQAKSVVDVVMSTVKDKVNQASESDLAKKAGIFFIYISILYKLLKLVFLYMRLGKLSGNISKTVLESGTKLGQSGPVKSFSSTAEAISAQMESETSLNSCVSNFLINYVLKYLTYV